MWYHDHMIDFTGPNVYRGLAGFFLAFDEADAGDETLDDGTNLRLPSGDFDIPLVLQDRRFARDGSLVFDPADQDGFLGDKFAVNGAIQPKFRVKRRKYRFRFLDGSNAPLLPGRPGRRERTDIPLRPDRHRGGPSGGADPQPPHLPAGPSRAGRDRGRLPTDSPGGSRRSSSRIVKSRTTGASPESCWPAAPSSSSSSSKRRSRT